MKYRAIYQWRKDDESPVFREENGECLTGKKLNDYLDEISVELKEKGILVRNHSFRAGVATLMAELGYPEKDIMVAGRSRSNAFMAYTKLPRLHRAKFSFEIVTKSLKV